MERSTENTQSVEIKIELEETENWSDPKYTLFASALQPGIIENVNLFAPIPSGTSKLLNLNTNAKWRILKQWLTNLKTKEPLTTPSTKQINLLWGIYETSIEGIPKLSILQHAIKEGLNRDYFYSKVWNIPKGALNTKEPFIEDIDIKELETVASQHIDFKQVRQGDIVYFWDFNVAGASTIYNKGHLENLEDDARVPPTINIGDYPISEYFVYPATYTDDVYLHTQDTTWEIKYIYRNQEEVVYLWKLETQGKSSQFIIYTPSLERLKKEWESGIVMFNAGNSEHLWETIFDKFGDGIITLENEARSLFYPSAYEG